MIVRKPLAYLFVTGLCLALHNGVIISADAADSPLWLSILLSYAVVVVTGYVLHGLLTFRQPMGLVAFVRYAFAMSANIPLAFITTWFWHEGVGLPMALAAPTASVCMLAINFVLARWAVTNPAKEVTAI
jgi:putative flippase GtrA